MIVTGCVLLVMFLVYDIKFAQVPIISKQFIKNKAIVAASWIGFLDFVSLMYLQGRNLLPILEHPRFPSTLPSPTSIHLSSSSNHGSSRMGSAIRTI